MTGASDFHNPTAGTVSLPAGTHARLGAAEPDVLRQDEAALRDVELLLAVRAANDDLRPCIRAFLTLYNMNARFELYIRYILDVYCDTGDTLLMQCKIWCSTEQVFCRVLEMQEPIGRKIMNRMTLCHL